MKPQITKLKNARGRIIGYEATFAHLTGGGTTPREAIAACEANVRQYLRDHERGSLVLTLFDRTITLEPSRYGAGFTYRLQGSDCVHGAYPTREEAEDRGVFHCAQNAWTLETDDAAFFAAIPPQTGTELAGWVRWQRAYAAARAAGMDDAQARQVA